MAKEVADVIVTAAVALDTVSGDGAAVVGHQLQGRAAADEGTAAGDLRLVQVLAISGDMGEVTTAVLGALGAGPRGEAVAVTHSWEDVGARLGGLILTAAAALDDLTGDAWEAVDERLRFLVERVAAAALAFETDEAPSMDGVTVTNTTPIEAGMALMQCMALAVDNPGAGIADEVFYYVTAPIGRRRVDLPQLNPVSTQHARQEGRLRTQIALAAHDLDASSPADETRVVAEGAARGHSTPQSPLG
ncbi:hypothetical protein [Streptomyces sp. NPDC056549]|uniref:hypothetical protein n=1 Tax=Streptomyces sp. NPDC056549 TaxID=3345864 RepID=UPI0036BB81F0